MLQKRVFDVDLTYQEKQSVFSPTKLQSFFFYFFFAMSFFICGAVFGWSQSNSCVGQSQISRSGDHVISEYNITNQALEIPLLSIQPSSIPTQQPSRIPSPKPSLIPSPKPSRIPSPEPSHIPTTAPSILPSPSPTTSSPTTSLLVAGDKVEGNWKGEGKWYPGKIARDRGDGLYDIIYDDGGSEEGVTQEKIRSIDSLKSTKCSIDGREEKDGNIILKNLTAHPLWYQIYKDVLPPSQIVIPRCAMNISVFVYDLPYKFHGGILDAIEQTNDNGESNCDFGRSPCTEVSRQKTYSTMRQHSGEVAILAKFLLLPRTTDPAKADLFIVPFFGATSKLADGCPWLKDPCDRHNDTLEELMALLSFYREYKQKHVFLNTRDQWDIPRKFLVPNHEHIVVLLGPREIHSRQVVAMPNGVGFGYPMPVVAKPRHHVFFLAGLVNPVRLSWFEQLKQMQEDNPDFRMELHEIMGHLTFDISVWKAFDYYSHSLLCPMPSGDLPYTHRFYDAIFAGCVPVVVAYDMKTTVDCCGYVEGRYVEGKYIEGSDGGLHCKSYWRLPESWDQHMPNYSCMELTYPGFSRIDWKDLIIEIPEEVFSRKNVSQYLSKNITMSEIYRKRDKIKQIRSLLVYDWAGTQEDAFTLLLADLLPLLKEDCSVQMYCNASLFF